MNFRQIKVIVALTDLADNTVRREINLLQWANNTPHGDLRQILEQHFHNYKVHIIDIQWIANPGEI